MSGGEVTKTAFARIAVLGAGRMGRGIATVFAYAGHEVDIIDFKERPQADFDTLAGKATQEVRETLALLGDLGLFAGADIADRLALRVRVLSRADAADALAKADVIFEGFPEVLDVKRQALAEASKLASKDAIIASTTSTILVDDLSPAVVGPERFLNAHWLNPAFIVPLVELSPGKATSATTIERLKALLESIGKIPIVCAARPGFIVPRIQAIAMNEAARLVEEGVASVEDIEKAVKYGFGFRFSVLGVLEFIDWGGVTFSITPAIIWPRRWKTNATEPPISSRRTCIPAGSASPRARASWITPAWISRLIAVPGWQPSCSG